MIEILLAFDPHLWTLLTPKQWFIITMATTMMVFYRVTWVKWSLATFFFFMAMTHVVVEWLIISLTFIIIYKTAESIYGKTKECLKFKYGKVIGGKADFNWTTGLSL